MSEYAATTTVSREASRNEIEKALKRYGADQFAYASSTDKAVIAFVKDGKQVRFDLPLPNRADNLQTSTGKLRVSSSPEEILAYIVLPSDMTVSDIVLPEIKKHMRSRTTNRIFCFWRADR